MNNYNKALLEIMPFVYQEGKPQINELNEERLKTIQEAIDNLAKYDKALDKACELIIKSEKYDELLCNEDCDYKDYCNKYENCYYIKHHKVEIKKLRDKLYE